MENLQVYIKVLFIITTAITLALFFKATNDSTRSAFIIIAWLVLQSIISLTGFYTNTTTIPPRFALLIGPPLLFIILLFCTTRGRKTVDAMNLKWLTLLHVIRIPVEVTLFFLFQQKYVPELMTFEGRNFDILSGISALIVSIIIWNKQFAWTRILLLVWNIVCLGLLINIVIIAILSAPFSFQQFAFEQPNKALLYFPFTWLPCCIVPIVLFCHLASIRILFRTPQ